MDEPQDRRGPDRARPEDHRARAAQVAGRGREVRRHARRGARRPLLRARHGQHADGRDLCRGRRRADRRQYRDSARREASTRSSRSTSITSISAPISATRWRWTRTTRASRRCRHLSRDAPRRAADGGDRRNPVRPAVLRFRALRPFERRPREDEHAPGPRLPGHDPHPEERGHPRDPQGARGSARRPRRNRRHRQPWQPPRALGRRADGEPVPHRPPPHGARDQGAHELRSTSTP